MTWWKAEIRREKKRRERKRTKKDDYRKKNTSKIYEKYTLQKPSRDILKIYTAYIKENLKWTLDIEQNILWNSFQGSRRRWWWITMKKKWGNILYQFHISLRIFFFECIYEYNCIKYKWNKQINKKKKMK